jgi:hypothetical protein
MGMFVDPQARVAVSDEQGNTIWIRAKMDVATKNRVHDAIAAVDGASDDVVELHLGSYNTALLVHNIVAWEGPAFGDARGRTVPCTRQNIERLDPDEPLVTQVLGEISRRNVRPESPDPNSPTTDGSTHAGAASSPASA